jgi:hypothetical protein
MEGGQLDEEGYVVGMGGDAALGGREEGEEKRIMKMKIKKERERNIKKYKETRIINTNM